MDFAAFDLNDLADAYRLVTTDVEHPFQDEVGIEAGGPKSRRVGRLKRQGKQHSGVERSMVVRIAWQNQPMGQGFRINRVQIGHAHRVRIFGVALYEWLEMAFKHSLARS